jgi:hypothetical protein
LSSQERFIFRKADQPWKQDWPMFKEKTMSRLLIALASVTTLGLGAGISQADDFRWHEHGRVYGPHYHHAGHVEVIVPGTVSVGFAAPGVAVTLGAPLYVPAPVYVAPPVVVYERYPVRRYIR